MGWVIAIAACYFVWVFIKTIKNKPKNNKRLIPKASDWVVTPNQERYKKHIPAIKSFILSKVESLEINKELHSKLTDWIFDYSVGKNATIEEFENIGGQKELHAYITSKFAIKLAKRYRERLEQIDLGITHGRWVYSPAPREYRQDGTKGIKTPCKHKSLNNKKFLLTQGVYHKASDSYIFPGESLECDCYCSPIIETN